MTDIEIIEELKRLIDTIDGRITESETRISAKIDDVEKRLAYRIENAEQYVRAATIRLDIVDKRLKDVEARLENVENEVQKININIENEVSNKIRALFDGYSMNTEKQYELEQHVDKHERIIQDLQVRIA